MPKPTLHLTAEAEEVVYSSRYSNNGASPMWCFNNTFAEGGWLFATDLHDGQVFARRTLVTAGEGADPAIPTDLD